MITARIAMRLLAVLTLAGCWAFAATVLPPDTSKILARLEISHG